MKEKKVSVIIPAHNEELNLPKCLDSLLKAKFEKKRLEIIIVNDCSKDNTRKIAEQYAKKNKFIKVVNFEKNKGAAAARNAGIKIAKNEFLLFLDADVIVDERIFQEHLKNFLEFDCTAGHYENAKRNNLQSLYGHYLAKRTWVEGSAQPTFNNGMYKKKVFKNNLFDEDFKYCIYEDTELSNRILEQKWKFKFEKKAKVLHLFEEKSIVSMFSKAFKSGINHSIFYFKEKRKNKKVSLRKFAPIFLPLVFLGLLAFFGLPGLAVVLLLLAAFPPSIIIIAKMSKDSGAKYFLPFAFLNFASKIMVYCGALAGAVQLLFARK